MKLNFIKAVRRNTKKLPKRDISIADITLSI